MILRVQKQTDCACMHKDPENEKWLPMGGQIGNSHICISSLAHGEQRKKKIRIKVYSKTQRLEINHHKFLITFLII